MGVKHFRVTGCAVEEETEEWEGRSTGLYLLHNFYHKYVCDWFSPGLVHEIHNENGFCA